MGVGMRRSVSPGFGAAALAERAIRLTRLRRPASLRPRFCSHDADLKRTRFAGLGLDGPAGARDRVVHRGGERVLEEFLGVLLMLGAGIGLAGLLLIAPRFLGRVRGQAPDAPMVSASQRYSTKFFLAGMFFVLIDLEVLLLYPWAVLLRELSGYGLVVALLFLIPVGVGVLYEWRKGALEW